MPTENLTFYYVKDKRPPTRKDIILWIVDGDGNIIDWKTMRLQFVIPKSQAEYDYIPEGEDKLLAWSDGHPLCDNDLWSYTNLNKRTQSKKSRKAKLVQKNQKYCPYCSCMATTMYDSEPGIDGWIIGCLTANCMGHIDSAYGFLNLCDAQTAYDATVKEIDDVAF